MLKFRMLMLNVKSVMDLISGDISIRGESKDNAK